MSPRDPSAYFNFSIPSGEVPSPTVLHPRFSRGAVASLVLGLVSLPAIFIHIGLFTAILGIHFGITGLVTVNRGGGRIKGGTLAIAGLTLCIISFIGWGAILVKTRQTSESTRVAKDELHAAENQLITNKTTGSIGATPAATDLATAYAATLKQQAAHSFSPEGGPISSTAALPTYCRLGKGTCIFIIQIPGYRKLSQSAKAGIGNLLWASALRTAANHPELLPTGTRLAVAARGDFIYGETLTGEIDDGEAPADRKLATDKLIPFFQSEPR